MTSDRPVIITAGLTPNSAPLGTNPYKANRFEAVPNHFLCSEQRLLANPLGLELRSRQAMPAQPQRPLPRILLRQQLSPLRLIDSLAAFAGNWTIPDSAYRNMVTTRSSPRGNAAPARGAPSGRRAHGRARRGHVASTRGASNAATAPRNRPAGRGRAASRAGRSGGAARGQHLLNHLTQ
ncbi:hypothetical protein GB937_000793 [Aspergillus fischeri]|nr:hypothetical protein GB937_000793 [Aspergillus fischeri]